VCQPLLIVVYGVSVVELSSLQRFAQAFVRLRKGGIARSSLEMGLWSAWQSLTSSLSQRSTCVSSSSVADALLSQGKHFTFCGHFWHLT
jgi:hypothetical protein